MSGTSRDSDKFMLRLPDGMREAIKTAADASGRSMNAEIVIRLSYTLGLDLRGEYDRKNAADIDAKVEASKQLLQSLSDAKEDLIEQIAQRVSAQIHGPGESVHHPVGRTAVQVKREKQE